MPGRQRRRLWLLCHAHSLNGEPIAFNRGGRPRRLLGEQAGKARLLAGQRSEERWREPLGKTSARFITGIWTYPSWGRRAHSSPATSVRAFETPLSLSAVRDDYILFC
jgi:hypothetical protein